VFPGPEEIASAAIARIEREVGAVPLALKLFWQRVGSVDLCGFRAACIYLLFISLGKDLAVACINDIVRPATVAQGILEFIVDVPAIALPGNGDAKIVEVAVGGFGVQPGGHGDSLPSEITIHFTMSVVLFVTNDYPLIA
jgi:hypothetical protein